VFFVHALLAFTVAVLLTAVFAGLVGRSGPWASAWLFFLVLFFASWAGGLWITPIGPSVWGIYWFPFLFVGVVVALLLASAADRPDRAAPAPRPEEADPAAPVITAAIATMLVWVLLVVLVLPIVIAYAV
jgi:hypothetical protein